MDFVLLARKVAADAAVFTATTRPDTPLETVLPPVKTPGNVVEVKHLLKKSKKVLDNASSNLAK